MDHTDLAKMLPDVGMVKYVSNVPWSWWMLTYVYTDRFTDQLICVGLVPARPKYILLYIYIYIYIYVHDETWANARVESNNALQLAISSKLSFHINCYSFYSVCISIEWYIYPSVLAIQPALQNNCQVIPSNRWHVSWHIWPVYFWGRQCVGDPVVGYCCRLHSVCSLSRRRKHTWAKLSL